MNHDLHNIPLVDSHCHLHCIDLTEFDNDLDQVLHLARAQGVEHMLCVCIEEKDIPALYQIAGRYPDVDISVGVHPNAEVAVEPNSLRLIELSQHPACVAIGETGLDYYRTETEAARELQRQRFREHIRAARASSKPLIIHTRLAAEDTLLLMQEESAATVGGVMHCFSESWEIAKRALDLNFYLSFSGIVTFKNATELQAVVKKIPSDRLLIETDSPYLAPTPFRGKQNHPALVRYVAQAISELRQVDYETLARQTTNNFYRCFRRDQ
jgi:TatD DNase family protein